MKLDTSLVQSRIDLAKQCLLNRHQHINLYGKSYLTWPLFFVDTVPAQSEEVDICTSGLGVVALSNFDGDEIKNLISASVNTIVSIRNVDGSWPSKISLTSKDNVSMEGVISDTYFALSALLKVDFLKDNPTIENITNLKTNQVLSTRNDRLGFVKKSIEWLLLNRVGQGWQYAGVSYLEDQESRKSLPAYTTPTANALIVVSQFLSEMESIDKNDALIPRMKSAINDSVRWLCDIINAGEKGGVGIKLGERARVSNTARVIVALCKAAKVTDSRLTNMIEERLQKAVSWLITNYTPSKIKPEDVNEDYFQFYIVKDTEGNATPLKRSTNHESFIESIVIEGLHLYYSRIKDKDRKPFKPIQRVRLYLVMKTAVEQLITNQLTSGSLVGAVKSRRTVNNELYTMYACCDAICILKLLLSDKNLFNKVKFSVRNMVVRALGVGIVALVITVLACISTDAPWYITTFLAIILPLFTNWISSKVF